MASIVFSARYAPAAPGPAATAHHTGATTASTVFSASDSITAAANPDASRSLGSRPTRVGTNARARSRSDATSASRTPTAARRNARPAAAPATTTAVGSAPPAASPTATPTAVYRTPAAREGA